MTATVKMDFSTLDQQIRMLDDMQEIRYCKLSESNLGPTTPTGKLNSEMTMTKYQELEKKIKELQAEVERLKNEEKANELPELFYRDMAMMFLKNPSFGALQQAFIWDSTPQGGEYWTEIAAEVDFNKKYKVPNEAIIQLQKWVIQSYQEEFGK